MSYWIPGWIQTNWLIANVLYWGPLTFCIFGYTVRTWRHFKADTASRDKLSREGKSDHYMPTDRLGTLVGRAVVSLLPLANLWAATFDLAPEVFRRVFEWLGKVLDQPVVPARKPAPRG